MKNQLLFLLAALLLCTPSFAAPAPADSGAEASILEFRDRIEHEQHALTELRASLAQAERISDVAFRIALPAMVLGALGSAGLFFSGAFGDTADSFVNSLAEKATTGYGERAAYEGISVLILSVAGGQVAIYITEDQKHEINDRIQAASQRLERDRQALDLLVP